MLPECFHPRAGFHRQVNFHAAVRFKHFGFLTRQVNFVAESDDRQVFCPFRNQVVAIFRLPVIYH